MDKYNTAAEMKSSILEQMEIMAGIVESLGNAGVDIILAQVGKPEDTYILFHYWDGAFRKWAEDNELNVVVEPIESEYHKWRIGTTVNGIDVHSYMSNREKEQYDGKSV